MAKTVSPLDQALIDSITKTTAASGEVFDAGKLVASDIYTASKVGASKAIDFASAQIPDVVHQLLMWKLAESAFYIVVAFCLIGLFFYIFSKIKVAVAEERDKFALYAYTTVFGGATIIISGGLLINNILDAMKILIAPKLYLIEYAATLISKVAN